MNKRTDCTLRQPAVGPEARGVAITQNNRRGRLEHGYHWLFLDGWQHRPRRIWPCPLKPFPPKSQCKARELQVGKALAAPQLWSTDDGPLHLALPSRHLSRPIPQEGAPPTINLFNCPLGEASSDVYVNWDRRQSDFLVSSTLPAQVSRPDLATESTSACSLARLTDGPKEELPSSDRGTPLDGMETRQLARSPDMRNTLWA